MSTSSPYIHMMKNIFLNRRAWFSLFAGCALFLLILLGSSISFEINYAEKIYPGVWIAGVYVGGLPPEEAANRLSQQIFFPKNGRIFIQDGQQQAWRVTPSELGLYLDPETSARQAFQIGRDAGFFENVATQIQTLQTPTYLSPVFVYDQRQAYRYLSMLAAQINKPVVEASVGLNGVDVVVRSGQIGRELNIPITLERITRQLQTLQDGLVPLEITETPPVILDASAQADLARKILSQALILRLPEDQTGEPNSWTFDVKTLAGMLSIERIQKTDGSNGYEVTLDSSKLRIFLKDLAPSLLRDPQNARFIFNDTTRQLEVIQPAVIGRALDVEETLKSIHQNLIQGNHSIPLVLNLTPPPADDHATAEQLGIRDLIRQEISYFYGSSAGRVQNITAAAGKFHGVLVPPGAVFSMSDTIGQISLDNGFAEALIIYNGRTVKGVGGGVCQVSTTLFRTAFFAGYPIVERYAHAYRVSYYEKVGGNRIDPRLAGLDATVFVPLVDFKFKNDSSSWLLMETYVNPKAYTLTWKFYSTSDGRKVTWETSGLTNIVPAPDPVYRENPDLPKGKINHIDYAVEGADVAVTRTVTRDSKIVLKDVIRTHYVPWPDQYEYGPGTELPDSPPSSNP